MALHPLIIIVPNLVGVTIGIFWYHNNRERITDEWLRTHSTFIYKAAFIITAIPYTLSAFAYAAGAGEMYGWISAALAFPFCIAVTLWICVEHVLPKQLANRPEPEPEPEQLKVAEPEIRYNATKEIDEIIKKNKR